jgi:hypothetical protein
MATFLTLFHYTSNASARAIMRDRVMRSAAPVDLPFAFFSTHRAGRASGPLHYGEAAVEVRVPAEVATVDESFRDGEQFLKVALVDLRPENFIRAHLAIHPTAPPSPSPDRSLGR